MPRTSSIKRLPSEIRERINTLLEQGRSLDEILEALAGLDVEVSRSALGRYKQSIDKVAERIRRSREVADALVRRLGEAPESRTARLNVELLHSVINDMLMCQPEPGEDAPEGRVVLDPKSAMLLSRALSDLTRAAKSDAELAVKIREEVRKEALRKLEGIEAEAKAGKGELDMATLTKVREAVYGLAP